jgi:hypothetical protein
MDRWEYQVILVNKWGRAMKRDAAAAAQSETWQFDESRSTDLISLLEEFGADGWDLIGIDPNKSYAQENYSYVGSLYIFQRPSPSHGG